jgi:general secretion pathway protein H
VTAPRHRSDIMRRHAGFSMIELLIVLVIIAIASALVIPMFGKGVSTTELKSAARQLASGLRLARSEALTQRRETFLVLDVAGRRFKVDQDPKEYSLPREIELKLFTAQKDLVDEKVGSIRFFPDGGSNGGRITVASGERKFEVDVDWLTGRVAILD